MINGRVPGAATQNFSGSMAPPVPIALALAVFVPRPLDLIGGCGYTPQKIPDWHKLPRYIKKEWL
jgi:hypothetical protein